MAIEKDPLRVTTGKGRLAYVRLWEPAVSESDDDKTPKYSCVFMFPKSDKKTKAKLDAAIEAAKEKGAREIKEWKGKVPTKDFHLPIYDGDDDEDRKEKGDEFLGHYFLNLKAKADKFTPKLLEKNPDGTYTDLRKSNEREKVYSGVIAHTSILFLPYYYLGKSGISVYLSNVLSLCKGEPFAGGGNPEKDFEDIEIEDDDFDL